VWEYRGSSAWRGCAVLGLAARCACAASGTSANRAAVASEATVADVEIEREKTRICGIWECCVERGRGSFRLYGLRGCGARSVARFRVTVTVAHASTAQ